MTKRKLNFFITISMIALYLICGAISFNNCHSIAANNFSNESEQYVSNITSYIHEFENEGVFDDNSIEELNYSLNSTTTSVYPSYFAMYDKQGNMLFESGSYIFSLDFGMISINDYFNDDLIKEYQGLNKRLNGEPELYKFDYLYENNKIVPVNLYFISGDVFASAYDDLTADNCKIEKLTLNNKKPTDTITNNNDSPLMLYTNISYDFNFFNKKIYNELQNKYSLDKIIETINNKNQDNITGGSGGGYYGNDEAYENGIYLLENGDFYYYVVNVKHNLFCDTLFSTYFKESVLNQTILFFVAGIAIYFTFNKLFDKNEKLNQTRQTFTSAAAHELKTPITIINNQCECLIEGVAPEKMQEYISNIYSQNRHLSMLVNNLLQYNRIDNTSLEKTQVSIKNVCTNELEKYEALIENKDLVIDTSLLEDVTIFADEKLITLVIDNFISNAIKHTPCGKTISISCDNARFIVFNEGEHIPDFKQNKIWEVLTRDSKDEVIESTGMGLSICKKILEAHKMKYGFKNIENGVEFYFSY